MPRRIRGEFRAERLLGKEKKKTVVRWKKLGGTALQTFGGNKLGAINTQSGQRTHRGRLKTGIQKKGRAL